MSADLKAFALTKTIIKPPFCGLSRVWRSIFENFLLPLVGQGGQVCGVSRQTPKILKVMGKLFDNISFTVKSRVLTRVTN